MTLTKQEKKTKRSLFHPLFIFTPLHQLSWENAFSFFPLVETSTPFPQGVNLHSDFGCREKRRRDSVVKVDNPGVRVSFFQKVSTSHLSSPPSDLFLQSPRTVEIFFQRIRLRRKTLSLWRKLEVIEKGEAPAYLTSEPFLLLLSVVVTISATPSLPCFSLAEPSLFGPSFLSP